ncbi:hypothetical protein [Halorussus pelagicus]|uniref:hypothetical protein n=1 Tax=Halorussus pelagicus TaxID=2505977 RepID=UPI000FFC0C91|nr:hypothetical protein [Halorussus pelagicus]
MKRVALTALLGLTLVLAGCSSAPGGSEASPSTTAETTTVTDVTTTIPTTATATATTNTDDTTTATVVEDDSPPGLSPSGVTDAEAFAAAHEAALANRSYTYTRNATVTAPNGTRLGNWTERVQVGPERLRFNNTQTGTGVTVGGHAIDDLRVYTNGSVTLFNTDNYRRHAGRGFAATQFSSTSLLTDAFDASETSVTTVERNERMWFQVAAERDDETFTYRYSNETVEVRATNLTATALVAPSGLVTDLTYEYDFERGNVSGHRTMDVRYSAVGETTVERPPWYDEAINATNGR